VGPGERPEAAAVGAEPADMSAPPAAGPPGAERSSPPLPSAPLPPLRPRGGRLELPAQFGGYLGRLPG